MGVIGFVGGTIEIGVDTVRLFFNGRVSKIAKGNILIRAGVAVGAAVGKKIISEKAQKVIVENLESASDAVDEYLVRHEARKLRFGVRMVTHGFDQVTQRAGLGRVSDRVIAGTGVDEAVLDRHYAKPKRRSRLKRFIVGSVANKVSDKLGEAAVLKAIERSTKGRRIKIH